MKTKPETKKPKQQTAAQRSKEYREIMREMRKEQLADYEEYLRRCGGTPISHVKP